MQRKRNVSKKTRTNWLLDAILFFSAVIAALSGIYFLYFPTSGFQGGRNPAYSLVIFFTRSGWEQLHTWGGILMIAFVLWHFLFHLPWVGNMARRLWSELQGKSGGMNSRTRMNLWLNLIVAFSFLLTAISGVYFLFVGGSHGGRVPDPMFLFPRAAWDNLHTWSGVVLIISAILHFVIHWRWVKNVTRKVLGFSVSSHNSQPIIETI